MPTLQNIRQLIADNKLDEALALLSEMEDTAEVYYLRGRALWRQGRRAEATTAYSKSATLDPDGPAAIALQQARSIEAFFNPDLLNP